MLSLIILVLWTLLDVVGLAIGMAIAARAVGSTRGRFWPAMRVVGVLVLLAIATSVLNAAIARAIAADMPSGDDPVEHPALARSIVNRQATAGVVLALVQFAVAYATIRRGFRLSAGQAFAPFGAWIAGLVLVITGGVLVIRPFLLEAFSVPTASMAPTIDAGGCVAACKMLRPRRWDIVVYHSTPAPKSPIYCKRLVALPGETLTFDGRGGLTVDGQPVTPPHAVAGRYSAKLPGSNWRFARYADGEPIHLSDHEVFLIGDNVDLSYDSRYTGPSDVNSIIGVVDMVYWPLQRARVLSR